VDHAKDALKRDGPDRLKRHYERCLDLNDPKGNRVKTTLERNHPKTLESEHSRFLEPDVARAFPDSGSVNRVLRLLQEVAAKSSLRSRRPAGDGRKAPG
jgi:hypothetical protein